MPLVETFVTLCVTFDALIKAASESHDNYERLNNGDGVSESRQAAGGTKEGTQMAGEQHILVWLETDEIKYADFVHYSCQQETHGPSPGLSPDALCS